MLLIQAKLIRTGRTESETLNQYLMAIFEALRLGAKFQCFLFHFNIISLSPSTGNIFGYGTGDKPVNKNQTYSHYRSISQSRTVKTRDEMWTTTEKKTKATQWLQNASNA